MPNNVTLRAPIRVTPDDIERAFFEQSLDQSSVALVFEQLRGDSAKRAAEEVNRALEVDILDVLAQGWVQVPAMNSAVQLSTLAQSEPAVVRLDQHKISSTSRVVLDSNVARSELPPLALTLEILVDLQSATLGARAGRIELLALGESAVIARLMYKDVVLKEHETSLSGALRDPFKSRPAEGGSIDIPI